MYDINREYYCIKDIVRGGLRPASINNSNLLYSSPSAIKRAIGTSNNIKEGTYEIIKVKLVEVV